MRGATPFLHHPWMSYPFSFSLKSTRVLSCFPLSLPAQCFCLAFSFQKTMPPVAVLFSPRRAWPWTWVYVCTCALYGASWACRVPIGGEDVAAVQCFFGRSWFPIFEPSRLSPPFLILPFGRTPERGSLGCVPSSFHSRRPGCWCSESNFAPASARVLLFSESSFLVNQGRVLHP